MFRITRMLAALGAVALLALGATAVSYGKTHSAQRSGDPVRHSAVRATVLQLVALGKGPCGDLDAFQIVVDGRPGMKLC